MPFCFFSIDCSEDGVSLQSIKADRRQTVWHICWEYPPHITGGLGVACSSLVESLSEQINVEVFHAAQLNDAYENSSYSGGHLNVSTRSELEQLLQKLLSGQYVPSDDYFMKVQRLCAHVLARKPSAGLIVHAHDWHSILAAIAVKKRYGTPFVLHIHSTQAERQGAQAKDFIYELEQWGMDEAEKVICVSANSAQFILQHYSVSESKIHVVHNACSATRIPESVSTEVKCLLFVGRMCSQKSPELMIEIMRRLVTRHTDLKLLMAGEGEELAAIREVVDFCQIAESVEVLGMLPHESMNLLYQRADVLCLPSIEEPFGIVAIEAAQHGLSVLLSDRCGAMEQLPSAIVIQHRDIALWVHELDKLIKDSARHRELAKSVQKEAASRTWQDAADEILAIYASIRN